MAKVIIFSRHFPKYHPKAGQPTHFVEQFWNSKLKMIPASIVHYYMLIDLNPEKEKHAHEFWQSIPNDYNLLGTKHHTIRAGNRFKKGDFFSPRVWGDDINPKSGKSGPYHSKQIIIAPDTEVLETYDFEIKVKPWGIHIYIKGFFGAVLKKDIYSEKKSLQSIKKLAKNDGLNYEDLLAWFQFPKAFKGQIICWNSDTQY